MSGELMVLADVAKDYQHLEDALPGFSRARELVKSAGDSLRALEMQGSKFDFYRFANRYRLAWRFQGVSIDGFEPDTVGGYGALVRLFYFRPPHRPSERDQRRRPPGHLRRVFRLFPESDAG